jgi:hypothetical protein
VLLLLLCNQNHCITEVADTDGSDGTLLMPYTLGISGDSANVNTGFYDASIWYGDYYEGNTKQTKPTTPLQYLKVRTMATEDMG